jgi:hypothetical protein
MTENLAEQPESEEQWQKAQQRVFLYLRLMNLPPLDGLEVALQTLKRARQAPPGEASPLRKSMHALRQVLSERESRRKEDRGTGNFLEIARSPLPAPLGPGFCRGVRSSPYIDRGFMLPEKVR